MVSRVPSCQSTLASIEFSKLRTIVPMSIGAGVGPLTHILVRAISYPIQSVF